MSSIPYKEPNDVLTADEWNVIFAAADAILTNYLGGLSPLFFGDAGNIRKFFFFNPVTPPTGLHPCAATGLAAAKSNLGFGYLRYADPSAIENLVAGLAADPPPTYYVLDSVSGFGANTSGYVGLVLTLTGGVFLSAATIRITSMSGYQVTAAEVVNPGAYTTLPSWYDWFVNGFYTLWATPHFTALPPNPFGVSKLTAPTLAAWHAAVFPENGYGESDSDYAGTINLDICINVLTRSGLALTLGPDYLAGSANGFPCSQGNGEVEIVHNYDAVDIIVSSDLEIATLGTLGSKYKTYRIHNFGLNDVHVYQVTIPPGCCKCLRYVNGNVVPGYNYFQKMVAGDPRFFGWGEKGSAQLSPFDVPSLIAAIGLPSGNGVPGNTLDLSKAWEMSALYTTLLAPPQASSIIFDLLCGFGPVGGVSNSAIGVSVVNGGTGGIPNNTRIMVNGGSGSGVYQAYVHLYTNGAGVVTSADISDGGNYAVIPTNPVNCIWGGVTVLLNLTFPTGAAFTGFANLAAFFSATDCAWSYNSTTKKASITTARSGKVLTDTACNLVKLLTTALSPPVHSLALGLGLDLDLSANSTFSRRPRLIASSSTDGNGVITNSAEQDSTDTWEDIYLYYTVADTVQKILDCLNALACALISLQNIKVLSTPFGPVLYWEEVYGINKNFIVDMVSGGISCFVSGNQVILGKLFLLIGSFQNFFLPVTAPLTQIHFPRQGRVYQAKRAVVHTGRNEPWQSNAGSYTTYEPPQLKRFFESQPVGTEAPLPATESSPVLARPDGASYLGPPDQVAVPANAAESLLCQVEHYNALASQINGIPVTPAMKQITAPGIPTYAPTGVPAPDPNGGTNYGTQPFFPRNCFYSWFAPESGPDTIADAMTALGLTVQTELPDDYGAPLLALRLEYQPNDTFEEVMGPDYVRGFNPDFEAYSARYRWITIDDARSLYLRLSLPFVLNEVLAPARFEDQQATVNSQSSTRTSSNSVNVGYNTLINPITGTNDLTIELPNSTYYHTASIVPLSPPSATEWDGFFSTAIRDAGFIYDAAGGWSRFPEGSPLYLGSKLPYTPSNGSFTSTQAVTSSSGLSCDQGPPTGFYCPVGGIGTAGKYYSGGGLFGAWTITVNESAPQFTYAGLFRTSGPEFYFLTNVTSTAKDYTVSLDWGALGDQFSQGKYPCILFLLENTSNKAVILLPRNFYDGTLHNTIEDSACEVHVLDGAGDLDHNQFVITTDLDNAQLIWFGTNSPGQKASPLAGSTTITADSTETI